RSGGRWPPGWRAGPGWRWGWAVPGRLPPGWWQRTRTRPAPAARQRPRARPGGGSLLAARAADRERHAAIRCQLVDVCGHGVVLDGPAGHEPPGLVRQEGLHVRGEQAAVRGELRPAVRAEHVGGGGQVVTL